MASNVKIYHNPRCSKSRQTLALIEGKGIEPEIILYLDNPPSKAGLKRLIKMLGIEAADLVRRKEQSFKDAGLSIPGSSAEELIAAMIKFPKLIERPIVVVDDKAVLGRPPENVLSIL